MAPSKKDLQTALEDKDKEVKQLETAKSDLEKRRREENAQSQLKLDETQESLTKCQEALKKCQAEFSSEKSRADQLTKEKEGLLEDLEETRKARTEGEAQQERASKEVKALSDELFAAKAKQNEQEQDTGPLTQKLKQSEAALAQELAQRQQVETSLAKLSEELSLLKSEKALDEKRRQDEAKTSAMEQKVLQDKVAAVEAQLKEAVTSADAEQARLTSDLEDANLSVEQAQVELSNAQSTAHKTELMSLANAGGKAMADRGHTEHVGFSEKLAQGLAQKVLELEDQLYEKSASLVKQGENLLSCAENLNTTKDKLKVMRDDMSAGRSLLLGKIAGGNCDATLYAHVSLAELSRLALKDGARSAGGKKKKTVNSKSMSMSMSSSKAEQEQDEEEEYGDDDFEGDEEGAGADGADGGSGGGVEAIGRLQKEGQKAKASNEKLKEKVRALQRELATSMTAQNEVRLLKDKTADLADRSRHSKEQRVRSDNATKHANEKVVALSEHIEKLMVHLKHEAAAKAKLVDLQRRTEKEAGLLRTRNHSLVKKNAGRERVIAELKEGARILEEQLRLMDEKYVELRAKLDWTRASSQKEVKKVQAEANSLRAQWALAVDSGSMPGASGGSMSMTDTGGGRKGRKGKGKNKGMLPSASAPHLAPLQNAPQVHSMRQTSEPLQGMPSNNNNSSGYEVSFDSQAQGALEQDAPWSTNKIGGLHAQAQRGR